MNLHFFLFFWTADCFDLSCVQMILCSFLFHSLTNSFSLSSWISEWQIKVNMLTLGPSLFWFFFCCFFSFPFQSIFIQDYHDFCDLYFVINLFAFHLWLSRFCFSSNNLSCQQRRKKGSKKKRQKKRENIANSERMSWLEHLMLRL